MSADLPWRPSLLGRKAFIVDTNSYVWHNGYEWVDLDVRDDLDTEGVNTFRSWDDLRQAWGAGS